MNNIYHPRYTLYTERYATAVREPIGATKPQTHGLVTFCAGALLGMSLALLVI
ncbi:hypothetical protein QWZ04_21095 [Vibrio tapetis subsp. quintayensis]|uniref:hypothetical protein n=1 Tax=Vibrio tapetis TaxID=52443 RepID=UPI0025B2CF36|nr:hypothetical protein [Vibrio tapetis]MDN3682805.1 hypothetical protein [Vibrio tapetis subsp. quintayensis]